MRRVLFGAALCAGMLLAGVTNASAAIYCSADPTYNIGLPISYSLNLQVSSPLLSTHVYLIGTKSTTTYGADAGVL